MKILVCKYCGDRIEPIADEPGVYTHEKDGYSICWAYEGPAVNAEPIEP